MTSQEFGQFALGLLHDAMLPGAMLDKMVSFRGFAEALAKGSATIADVVQEPPADA